MKEERTTERKRPWKKTEYSKRKKERKKERKT